MHLVVNHPPPPTSCARADLFRLGRLILVLVEGTWEINRERTAWMKSLVSIVMGVQEFEWR